MHETAISKKNTKMTRLTLLSYCMVYISKKSSGKIEVCPWLLSYLNQKIHEIGDRHRSFTMASATSSKIDETPYT